MTRTIDDRVYVDKKWRLKVKDIAKGFIVEKQFMNEELFEYTWKIVNKNYNRIEQLRKIYGPKKAIEILGEYVAWKREQKPTIKTSFEGYLRKYHHSPE
ncbi:MAG: hypothetical protein Q7J54_03770 [Candidatus Woesearchaeota archaeon]|nr:hypothetical protein [Candidatus Woesearchaeota archaeon]